MKQRVPYTSEDGREWWVVFTKHDTGWQWTPYHTDGSVAGQFPHDLLEKAMKVAKQLNELNVEIVK